MKNQRSSIDGFIPRRSENSLGNINSDNIQNSILNASDAKTLPIGSNSMISRFKKQKTNMSVVRSDIDESLREIDDSKEPVKKLSRGQRRRIAKMAKKPKNFKRRITKWVLITLLMAILAFGGYAAYKFIAAGNNIFQGSIFDILQSQPLKQDSNGRSNFLIVGTSEDDPGHDAGYLTDSMLVVSVDQTKKDVYMFSIPRDLQVQYGMACPEGYSGKINSFFSCVSDGSTNDLEQERLSALRKIIGDIVGLDIQYGVHVNWQVLKDTVNAVGGIDVNVQGSNGEKGVLDRNADWRCNYSCYYVKYDNGVHHMDGEHALYFAMARGDDNGYPTYGLSRSNFDREINQQKVLIALKEKATSTGTISNLGTITKLLEALGNNLRTNIKSNEIRTLTQVVGEIKSTNIHRLSLIDGDNAVMNGNGNPKAGLFNYTDIKAFINYNLNSDPVVKEAAPIVVLNGTGQSGYGQAKADKLVEAGFNVTLIDNAPDGTYGKVEVYQIGKGNVATADKLAKMYKVTIKKSAPPIPVNGNVRFVIIFGAITE